MLSGQALIKAIGWREWDEASKIILKDTTSKILSFTDNDGRNPLHRACSRGAPSSFMKIILEHSNENTLMQRDNNGLTPLHWAASSGAEDEVILMVVEACARAATVVDKAGRTPYDLAKGRKKGRDVVQRLKDAGQLDEIQTKANDALAAGKASEAINCYTNLIDMFGSSRVWHSNRSAAYLMSGDAERALDDGEKCIEIDPHFPEGYVRKGAALQACHMDIEAVDVFKQGLELFPNDPDLQMGLSQLEEITNQSSFEHVSNSSESPASASTSTPPRIETALSYSSHYSQPNDAYTDEIDDLREEIQHLSTTHGNTTNELHDEIEHLTTKHAEEMEQLRTDHALQMDSYVTEIEDIKREAEEALQLQEQDAMAEIELLRSEIEGLRHANDRLQERQRCDDVEETEVSQEREKELEDLRMRMDELRAQVTELMHEKDVAEETIKTRDLQLSKLRIDVEMLNEEKDTLNMDTMGEIGDLRSEIEDLREANERLKTKQSDVAKETEKVEDSKEEVQELTVRIEELESQVAILTKEKEDAEATVKDKDVQISKLRIDLEVVSEEKDTLNMELTEVQTKLMTAETKADVSDVPKENLNGKDMQRLMEAATRASEAHTALCGLLSTYSSITNRHEEDKPVSDNVMCMPSPESPTKSSTQKSPRPGSKVTPLMTKQPKSPSRRVKSKPVAKKPLKLSGPSPRRTMPSSSPFRKASPRVSLAEKNVRPLR